MLRNKRAELLTVAVVLVGASAFAFARMAPTAARTIPYQGVLEQNGAVANGDYLMRFGLFVAPPDATAVQCVTTDDCALWSEEQVVTVENGRFSVLLGDSDADLTDQILANNTLFLAMAVKEAADPGVFSMLEGVQEIVPQPWAARAARANAFRVTGGLTVEGGGAAITGNSSVTGTLGVSGGLSAASVSVTGTITTTVGNISTGTGNISAASGTVTATNVNTTNLSVTSGLPITKSAVVDEADNNGGGDGPTTDTGVPIGRSMCFLTQVWVHDNFGDESVAACHVYEGPSTWLLQANSDVGTGDPDVACTARCITW